MDINKNNHYYTWRFNSAMTIYNKNQNQILSTQLFHIFPITLPFDFERRNYYQSLKRQRINLTKIFGIKIFVFKEGYVSIS